MPEKSDARIQTAKKGARDMILAIVGIVFSIAAITMAINLLKAVWKPEEKRGCGNCGNRGFDAVARCKYYVKGKCDGVSKRKWKPQ